MGLFNLFSRQSKSAAEATAEAPRCDHYSFTHVVLRDAAFANPTQCITTLASADSADYVAGLWQQVVATCMQHRQPNQIKPDDILIHKIRVGAFPCALIEMPTPQEPTEAFFVALVLAIDLSRSELKFEASPLRFITLEHASGNETQLKTVLGEWVSSERYISHGPGPYPGVDEFAQRVTEIVVPRRMS